MFLLVLLTPQLCFLFLCVFPEALQIGLSLLSQGYTVSFPTCNAYNQIVVTIKIPYIMTGGNAVEPNLLDCRGLFAT